MGGYVLAKEGWRLGFAGIGTDAKEPGTFYPPPSSKSVSILSGAQYQADGPMSSSSSTASLASSRAKLSDADLANRARLGDRGAYGQIVSLYQDRLYNALLRLMGDPDDAAELTQETFTRGLSRIESFRGASSPYTWLFRIAMNLGLSVLRKTRQRKTFCLSAQNADRASAPGLDPAEEARRTEMHKLVLEALGRVEAEYRAVLVMREIEGFDYQQIAEVLGLPLGTIKSRLFRARLALRDELHGYFDDGSNREPTRPPGAVS